MERPPNSPICNYCMPLYCLSALWWHTSILNSIELPIPQIVLYESFCSRPAIGTQMAPCKYTKKFQSVIYVCGEHNKMSKSKWK
jgi:hypothetical protein